MRLWPRSLAGRLAALLVLALVAAQGLSFALFVRERITTIQAAYREDLTTRFMSLVRLMEDAPPDLRPRLADTASSALLRIVLTEEPLVLRTSGRAPGRLRARLAALLGRPVEHVQVSFADIAGRGSASDEHTRPRRRGWLAVSVRLDDQVWLNAATDRPPVPPLGAAFTLSLLLSATAVALVGALGVRQATRPMRRLAEAADRFGRGDAIQALPEDGPEETRLTNIAFNRMRERLDRFVRDRTAMLAALAHDLRTPITSLRLRAEFVEDEETRSRILDTLAEMQAMAEATLAFARGDAENEQARPTDLAALVESVVADASDLGRPVTMDPSPAVTLRCRPSALRRALANLVDNATSHAGHARVHLEQAPHEVRIVIEDDGPGIPEQELERVFEPFVRLEESRSRATGGSGLGLSIARSTARSHGGDLVLENRSEGGLRAVLSLPR